jgi:hypothetical protein
LPGRQGLIDSALNHRQLNNPLLDLSAFERGSSNKLELKPVLVEIAQCLIFGDESRRQPAGLPDRSDRKNERDASAPGFIRFGRNSDALGHAGFPPTSFGQRPTAVQINEEASFAQ